MGNVIRIALPEYNVFTETDIDNYSLYSDEDNILIKEHSRGGVTISHTGNQSITHSLTYIPMVMVFCEISTGVWRKILGDDEFNSNEVYYEVTTSNLIIYNNSGSTKNFKYYIFYDQIV